MCVYVCGCLWKGIGGHVRVCVYVCVCEFGSDGWDIRERKTDGSLPGPGLEDEGEGGLVPFGCCVCVCVFVCVNECVCE